MRIEIKDKHNNVIFYVDEKEIEGVGFKTLLYIRGEEERWTPLVGQLGGDFKVERFMGYAAFFPV